MLSDYCFNTQPPEGGWPFLPTSRKRVSCFNTQPPEGGWVGVILAAQIPKQVSTHSRPKAAGCKARTAEATSISFNTQPPEGGWDFYLRLCSYEPVSTHSRPKAAGFAPPVVHSILRRFNTQPPEGGWQQPRQIPPRQAQFQHTAARRRLELAALQEEVANMFQHTAARRRLGQLWSSGI